MSPDHARCKKASKKRAQQWPSHPRSATRITTQRASMNAQRRNLAVHQLEHMLQLQRALREGAQNLRRNM
ncbi:hypothetical protein [Xanthomonas euvesicatoria]|uniref:hypothetical protein n=1 Tax=Xanthomonas euvesicatoria TaxID=456327 RepID=UPI001C454CA9|nr:hypothetical protein [Xanthomonas euvesicatoria]